MPPITPLILTPILKPKVWGGRRLARLGKQLPPENSPDALIGESWELADLASTSASGGGGEAARSVIAHGPHAGRTLHSMMDEWGDDLLPHHLRTKTGDFPLLVKFLDAREHLSIQVHPSPAYAAAHPDAHLKTECWFVLDASPPSPHSGSAEWGEGQGEGRAIGDSPDTPVARSSAPVIYKGLRPGITPDLFRRLIAEGRVPEAMLAVPAIVGQMHDLPSGTCHALGAGVLVAEVQTPSDTTFRVYDWAKEYGRQGRALHIEESLACIDFGPAPAATALAAADPGDIAAGPLLRNQFFTIDQLRIPTTKQIVLTDPGCQVLMVVGGTGVLRVTPTSPAPFPVVSVKLGDTVILPAALAGTVCVAASNDLSLLRVGLAPPTPAHGIR